MNIVNYTNGTGEYIKCLKMETDCFIRQRVTVKKGRILNKSKQLHLSFYVGIEPPRQSGSFLRSPKACRSGNPYWRVCDTMLSV